MGKTAVREPLLGDAQGKLAGVPVAIVNENNPEAEREFAASVRSASVALLALHARRARGGCLQHTPACAGACAVAVPIAPAAARAAYGVGTHGRCQHAAVSCRSRAWCSQRGRPRVAWRLRRAFQR
jgi:hypothetical protein